MMEKVDLRKSYNDVLRIKTTPGACVVLQIMFSTTGDEESYMANTFEMFRDMFFRLQPNVDLKPGNDVRINVTGYVKGNCDFVF